MLKSGWHSLSYFLNLITFAVCVRVSTASVHRVVRFLFFFYSFYFDPRFRDHHWCPQIQTSLMFYNEVRLLRNNVDRQRFLPPPFARNLRWGCIVCVIRVTKAVLVSSFPSPDEWVAMWSRRTSASRISLVFSDCERGTIVSFTLFCTVRDKLFSPSEKMRRTNIL